MTNEEREHPLYSRVSMFGPGQTGEAPASPSQFGCHYYFCMDESGSMKGKPWNDLMTAYLNALQLRIQSQNVRDVVTVTFATKAQTRYSGISVSDALARGRLPQVSVGTVFRAGLSQVAAEHAKDTSGATPVVIFMSDGGDGGGGDHGASYLRSIIQDAARRNLNTVVYTVAFGAHAAVSTLTQLADEADGYETNGCKARGEFLQALSGSDLKEAFAEAVSGDISDMKETLADRISDKLAHDLGIRIATNFV